MADTPDASIETRSPGEFALGYRPQLDGMRAVAVLAVMVFHAAIVFRHNPLPGGFLGVDLFFALSGFLITTILAQEWLRREHIDFGAFYARRALRLFPAVALLLVSLLVYSQVVLHAGSAHFVRRQVLWTALYVQNWHLVFAPTGLTFHLAHVWSLAVEEQFYLVWPLVLWGLLSLRRSPRTTIGIVLGMAAVSALVMAVLGESSPLHVWYGTDARVQTLLLGAALGLAAVFGRLPRSERRWPMWVGWLGLAAYFVVAFATYDDVGAWNSRGGLTLAGIAGVAFILGVICAPKTLLARVLATRVLVAIGRISYGLYLWHFPVFMVVTPDQRGDFTIWNTGLSFWPLLVVRFAVTLAIATTSFVLVERPCLAFKRRFERRVDEPGGPMVLSPGVTVSQ